MKQRFRQYLRTTAPVLVFLDLMRVFAVLFAGVLALLAFRWVAVQNILPAPLHRRLWANPDFRLSGWVYGGFWVLGFVANAAWISLAVRNFVGITLKRREPTEEKAKKVDQEKLLLPAYPYKQDSFTVILGELQDRDGSRVPNEKNPETKPRWLTLPETALYTNLFITGGIGSGKTAAVAYPVLKQMIGFERPVEVRTPSGQVEVHSFKFSGVALDEKGDFIQAATAFAAEWGREADIVRITPGGHWLWNPVYNPNLATWAVGYQLGWIIKNFNKGATSGDPFWESAPKELVMDYLTLEDDGEGYYTLFSYLQCLIDDTRQDELHDKAMARFAHDPAKVFEMERRWKSIKKRRDGMSVNLRGALESCAKSGIDMFAFPEIRKTFCPTREEYFTAPFCPWPKRNDVDNVNGMVKPRENVFVGFDQTNDYGKIIGLEMNKETWFDAAKFVQVALKSQWQDSILRRDAIGTGGKLILPPRFGPEIGYCPSFLFADECQENATPKDGEFKGRSRSKRGCMVELTQSHSSILNAFGSGGDKAADTYFQNSMTHIYLRQLDLPSMEKIQKEVGLKDVAQTTMAVTEGGQHSELNYTQGEFVNQNLAMSSTKTSAIVEKPFLEIEELKTLPNNCAVVMASTGEKVLPATLCYLRPSWVFKKYPELSLETPWLDWPEELRKTYDLDSIPQELNWSGWSVKGPLDHSAVITMEDRLGAFLRPALPPSGPTREATEPGPQAEETAPPLDMPGQVHLMPVAQRPTPEELEQAEGARQEAPKASDPAPLAEAEHLERQRQVMAATDGGHHAHDQAEEIHEEAPAHREGSPFDDFPVDDL